MLNEVFFAFIFQAQPEELSVDDLMEINTRLQNQLNQEKNDMQMKSEELNILIRSHISSLSHLIGDQQLTKKNSFDWIHGSSSLSNKDAEQSWCGNIAE